MSTQPTNPFDDPEPRRRIGVSFRASYSRRVASGFMAAYFSKPAVLDIGYRGEDPLAEPITETAIGVELDYPGYDGRTLPFADESQDTVLAAHVLEHIDDYANALRDWLRVLKIGGFLVVIVPHRDLYERAADLPSRWNGDHKRFYTPASLLAEVESALPVNGFRVRHLFDNDVGFDYARDPALPPVGGFEIELVLEKIARPEWADRLRYSPATQEAIDRLDGFVFQAVRANLDEAAAGARWLAGLAPSLAYFPLWSRLRVRFPGEEEEALKRAVRPLLALVRFDAAAYVSAYEDISRAVESGAVKDVRQHWLDDGYFEGRSSFGFDPHGLSYTNGPTV